jgi:2-C-methyl-D-erythritol 4-phosphate cytidylyltransferase
MGADIPKQYLPLAGATILEHTLAALVAHRRIDGVVVALAADDGWWGASRWAGAARVRTVPGGGERHESVLAGLRALRRLGADSDWVLVHDAARPCLRAGDLDLLLETLWEDPVGGLLALPVRDTMKRAGDGDLVAETVSRDGLWHALTPQMFRLGPLTDALAAVVARGGRVTDEAQAMELAGFRPRLVEGHGDNIKVTRPQDLLLAERFLAGREEG